MSDLQQAFIVDGKVFNTKAEANDYIRRPKIKAAFMDITEGNEELSDWLVENQNVVNSAFETGTIKRITKSDHKKIDAAFDAMAASGDSVYAFLVDNRDALELKYKTQARLTEEEKTAQAISTVAEAADDNTELGEWVVENKDSILDAYNAGKKKREVSPKAKAALEEYRKKKAAEKASA